MKLRLSLIAVASLSLIAFLSCESMQKKSTDLPEKANSWSTEMNIMYSNYLRLLPFMYEEKSYVKEKNRKIIGENLKSLAAVAKRMKHFPQAQYPEQDPSLRIMMSNLEANLKVANSHFESGDLTSSRRRLKNSMSYCFYCHTRMAKGLQLEWGGDAKDINIASPFEKADFLVASRRFKESEEVLKAVVEDKRQDAFVRGRALEKMMTVGLRVREEPTLTKFMLAKLIENGEHSIHRKNLLKRWLKDIKDWEKKRRQLNTVRSISSYLKTSIAESDLIIDEARYARYLLASEKLYELLEKPASKMNRAKTYYLLGHTYSIIRDSVTWELNEIYYEACIQQAPFTQIAKRCYRELESSIVLGYSGSSGVFIPYDVREKLNTLKRKVFK